MIRLWVVLRRPFSFCPRVTAATMMTMSAGSTRSGCFRFADACPAWMQIDTERYLPGGYLGTEYMSTYIQYNYQ